MTTKDTDIETLELEVRMLRERVERLQGQNAAMKEELQAFIDHKPNYIKTLELLATEGY